MTTQIKRKNMVPNLHKDMEDIIFSFSDMTPNDKNYVTGNFEKITTPMLFSTEYGYIDLMEWVKR